MPNLNPVTHCDPLGDKNVVATLKAVPSNVTRPEKSVIIVATKVMVGWSGVVATVCGCMRVTFAHG